MKDNYPMGAAFNPSAPYNQSDPKPVEVDCCVSYSLSKSMPVKIQNYNVSEEYESDIDDEGHRYCHKFEENNFDETNFIDEFKNDNEAIGIPTLLKELQKLASERIADLHIEKCMYKGVRPKEEVLKELKHYQVILEASQGWVVDDLDVCQE